MSEAERRADDAARAGATDPSRSILLQAPAGSGKTAVLTQRFLRLLCTVDEPQAILAITFTRKAAGEMRARVMRALRAQVADTEPCATGEVQHDIHGESGGDEPREPGPRAQQQRRAPFLL